jgi:hypothetical protein
MIKSVGAVSALASALTPLFMPAAYAHDGWAWTESGFLQLEGTIAGVYIGSQLSTLDVDVAGITWRVELGSLPVTIGSGVVRGRVRVGDDVIVVGSLLPERATRRLRAVRIVVNGVAHDLHPEHARLI